MWTLQRVSLHETSGRVYASIHLLLSQNGFGSTYIYIYIYIYVYILSLRNPLKWTKGGLLFIRSQLTLPELIDVASTPEIILGYGPHARDQGTKYQERGTRDWGPLLPWSLGSKGAMTRLAAISVLAPLESSRRSLSFYDVEEGRLLWANGFKHKSRLFHTKRLRQSFELVTSIPDHFCFHVYLFFSALKWLRLVGWWASRSESNNQYPDDPVLRLRPRKIYL